MPDEPKPRRRRHWWSISVRGLMLLVLVVGGLIGWEINRVARMRRAVTFLERELAVPPGDRDSTDFSLAPPPPPPNPTSGASEVAWVTAIVIFDDQRSGFVSEVDRPFWVRWVPERLQKALGVDHFRFPRAIELGRRPRPEDWDAIHTLSSVRDLSIHYSALNDADLVGVSSCSGLRALTLTNTKITDKSLVGIGQLRNLKKLFLRGAKTTPDGLASLANLTELEELDLDFKCLTDAGLSHLRGMTKLRSLVSGQLTDVGLSYLQGMTRLERLVIQTSHMTDQGLATIAKLPRLKTLRISPAFPGVQPAFALSASGIEQFSQLPQLENLALVDPLTVDDAWLKPLGKLTSLTYLGLVGAGITDGGLAPLGALSQLNTLEIGSPQLTDGGLKALFPLKRLTTIILSAEVSDAGIASLQAALPSLRQAINKRWLDLPLLKPAEATSSP